MNDDNDIAAAPLDLDALVALEKAAPLHYSAALEYRHALRNAAPALIAAAKERDALKAERDEAMDARDRHREDWIEAKRDLALSNSALAETSTDLVNTRAKLAVAEKALEKLAIERVLIAGKVQVQRAEAWKTHCENMNQIAAAALAAIQATRP